MVEFFIFIKEHQKVELIYNEEKRVYGTITSVIGDKVTIVTEQKPVLKKNQEIEINTYSENGIYCGMCKVLDYLFEYKKRTIIISYPQIIKHTQRREYLRADINADFELEVTGDNSRETIKGKTKNICGKGLSFLFRQTTVAIFKI